ncbi:hypothetical protein [Streptomyces sp. NBC_00859]|uniref:hypothetical protein n=1 Tax=Streptomyces sp. NBC_00859 TaxID=2903682 RepID=UPI003869DD4D|nr:hypothetical protein OG584_33905 [Streptomyces sp. NBC_00859]
MKQGEASVAGEHEEFVLAIGPSWMASKSEYPACLSEEHFNRFVPTSGPVDVQLSIVDESMTEFERTAGMQFGESEQGRNLTLTLRAFRDFKEGRQPAGPGTRDLVSFFESLES